MRATLNIPDNLIEDLVKETGAKTKTLAITKAIEDYLKKRRLENSFPYKANWTWKIIGRKWRLMKIGSLKNNSELIMGNSLLCFFGPESLKPFSPQQELETIRVTEREPPGGLREGQGFEGHRIPPLPEALNLLCLPQTVSYL
jgi:hypothetical protein